MDIQDTAAESGGLFRTLACLRDRDAAVVVSRDVTGVIPRRVALAETLGRLLFEARGRIGELLLASIPAARKPVALAPSRLSCYPGGGGSQVP